MGHPDSESPIQQVFAWCVFLCLGSGFTRPASLRFPSLGPKSALSSVSAPPRKAEASDLENSINQHWLSTCGMLALLIYWGHRRRTKSDRATSSRALIAICSKCMAVDVAATLTRLPLPTDLDCACAGPAGRTCQAVASFTKAKDRIAVSHGHAHDRSAAELMLATFPGLSCDIIRAHARHLIETAAKSIEDERGRWGKKHWHSDPQVMLSGPTRKRRLDEEVRQQAQQSMQQQECRQLASSSVCQQLDKDAPHRFSDIALTELKLAARSEFAAHLGGSLALSLDAGRFGKPGKEHLIGLACSCKSNMAVMMTPEVAATHVHSQQTQSL